MRAANVLGQARPGPAAPWRPGAAHPRAALRLDAAPGLSRAGGPAVQSALAETPVTGRDAFLATIRHALGRAPGDAPPDDAALLPDAGALDERAAAILKDCRKRSVELLAALEESAARAGCVVRRVESPSEAGRYAADGGSRPRRAPRRSGPRIPSSTRSSWRGGAGGQGDRAVWPGRRERTPNTGRAGRTGAPREDAGGGRRRHRRRLRGGGDRLGGDRCPAGRRQARVAASSGTRGRRDERAGPARPGRAIRSAKARLAAPSRAATT